MTPWLDRPIRDGWQRRCNGICFALYLTVIAIPSLLFVLASRFPVATRLWWTIMAEFYALAWYQIRTGRRVERDK